MRKFVTMTAAVCMTAAMALTAYGAEWKAVDGNWQYVYDDGSTAKDGWTWIDGKCYYFTPEGYCLMDTTTPDGCIVDASGAWTVDGAVQTQPDESGQGGGSVSGETSSGVVSAATEYVMDEVTIQVPEGYVAEQQDDGTVVMFSAEQFQIVAAASEDMGDEMDGMEGLLAFFGNDLLDVVVTDSFGTPDSASDCAFASGTWRGYYYGNVFPEELVDEETCDQLGISKSGFLYVRIRGRKVQLVLFMGNTDLMDPNVFMNTYVK